MSVAVIVLPTGRSRTLTCPLRVTAADYRSLMPPRPTRLSALAVGLVVAVTGCTATDQPAGPVPVSGPSPAETTRTPAPAPHQATAPSASPRTPGDKPGHEPGNEPGKASHPSCVAQAMERMDLAERAAQLLMVGVPADSTAPPPSAVVAVRDLAVGSVILTGRSAAGVKATAALVESLQRLAEGPTTQAVGLEVAVDQEGGQVQVLSGPGFSTIPDALTQGLLPPAQLRSQARTWGAQLAAAGITVNLAPVADTVPAGVDNDPIGDFDREYATRPAAVTASATAFAAGMLAGGVAPVVKHFPGLGRASGNTDTTAGVVDTVTTRRDPYLQPFRAAVDADTPYVMVATASYQRIDPGRLAAFSPVIVERLLRRDLGFDGVVISDDLGAARAVVDVPVGRRATQFVAAGGDVVLTVVPEQAPAMVAALVQRARAVPTFGTAVAEAARRVLTRKAVAGLLPCRR